MDWLWKKIGPKVLTPIPGLEVPQRKDEEEVHPKRFEVGVLRKKFEVGVRRRKLSAPVYLHPKVILPL